MGKGDRRTAVDEVNCVQLPVKRFATPHQSAQGRQLPHGGGSYFAKPQS